MPVPVPAPVPASALVAAPALVAATALVSTLAGAFVSALVAAPFLAPIFAAPVPQSAPATSEVATGWSGSAVVAVLSAGLAVGKSYEEAEKFGL